jgi:cyclopropane fatty-acyl-phospholipid synthase-like methyltransferase
MLAWSEASERNKGPILAALSGALRGRLLVLEIGAGTGQHAVHFARHLQELEWQPTECAPHLGALGERVRLEGTPNLRSPIPLDVNDVEWPIASVDVVYSANTLHIMAWPEVEAFFRGVGRVLVPGGQLAIYGPFRFDGNYTSDSNAEFDRYLRERDPESGIRDFEAVDALAAAEDLRLVANHAMPANNQLLIWRRAR